MNGERIELSLEVNGREQRVAVEAGETLAVLLRTRLGLTGTKIGCNQGVCGACTVSVDGQTVRGCLTLAATCQGKQVRTIEGYADGDRLQPLQQAFIETAAAQCGFCTSGMIASAQALLEAQPDPTIEEIQLALSGNLCRCTGYKKIIDAVLLASRRINDQGGAGHV